MTARKRRTSVRSYRFYRHNGGLSANGQLVLPTAYNLFDGGQGLGPNNPMFLYDDVYAAQGEQWPSGGFVPQGMQIINDAATSIFFSADGVWDLFEVKAGEFILYDFYKEQHIWLRGQAGGENFRLTVW